MKIKTEWFTGEKPSFNVHLFGSGEEPFLTVKGCRIASGAKGEFVSWPATKRDSGKYWQHVYSSEAFTEAVLSEAKKSAPQQQSRPAPKRAAVDEDDIPF